MSSHHKIHRTINMCWMCVCVRVFSVEINWLNGWNKFFYKLPFCYWLVAGHQLQISSLTPPRSYRFYYVLINSHSFNNLAWLICSKVSTKQLVFAQTLLSKSHHPLSRVDGSQNITAFVITWNLFLNAVKYNQLKLCDYFSEICRKLSILIDKMVETFWISM